MAAGKKGSGVAAAAAANDGPKTAPRDYIVMRELTVKDLIALAQGADDEFGDATVLVELGHAQARTPKEARRNVAKDKLEEAELAPESGGVPLNAVPARALTSGRGIVKMRNEPKWDD